MIYLDYSDKSKHIFPINKLYHAQTRSTEIKSRETDDQNPNK